MPTCDVTHTAF
jgi:hypothetical protein